MSSNLGIRVWPRTQTQPAPRLEKLRLPPGQAWKKRKEERKIEVKKKEKKEKKEGEERKTESTETN